MNRERGASLVEFALVLPLMLMIIVGLVSAGAAYNLKITLTHAAREAARYATILPIPADADDGTPGINIWLTDVRDHMLADAEGALDSGNPVYCIAFVDLNESGTDTMHIDQAGTIGAGSCFGDGRGDSEWRVQVAVQRDTDFNALFFSKTITMATQAVSRYEVMVSG
jgi:hypothetical protein